MIRRWPWGAGAVLAALTVNAAWHVGLFPLLVLAGAAAGFLLLVAGEFLVSGASAAQHSLQMERDIRAVEAARQRRREITR